MRASGVEIEIPEDWGERNRPLDIIVASPAESTVYESSTGGIHYAVLVRLVARSVVILTDCDINTKYDDEIVLESFRDPVCRLGDVEYWQRDVLNQRIENTLRLSRGEMVEGYVLASGFWRIPIEYGEFPVPFEIVFSDQFDHGFPATGKLSVLRHAQRDNTKIRRGTSLYGVDATGKPAELSVSEEARRRYRELTVQEKNLQTNKASARVTDD